MEGTAYVKGESEDREAKWGQERQWAEAGEVVRQGLLQALTVLGEILGLFCGSWCPVGVRIPFLQPVPGSVPQVVSWLGSMGLACTICL